MKLNRETRKEIIGLLVQHVNGASQQNAMLSAIFFDHPARYGIPSGTDSKTFAVTLLEAASRETIDGEPGVIVLLDELRGRVGVDKGREIDAMIAQLRLVGDDDDPMSNPRFLPRLAGAAG